MLFQDLITLNLHSKTMENAFGNGIELNGHPCFASKKLNDSLSNDLYSIIRDPVFWLPFENV